MNGSNGYKGWDDRRMPVKLAVTPWARWVRRGAVALVLLMLGAIVVGVWSKVEIGAVLMLPVFLLVILVTAHIGQRERFDRLVPTRLLRGLCPKCFYRLDNAPREEDNATVCPECGAAWVLPGKAKKG